MAAHPRSAVRWTLSRLLLPVLGCALASGCATFKSSQRLDVGPFAENTIGMIGEVQRVTKPVVWTYLKKYESLPSIMDVRQAYGPVRTLMRGVALYSTQIVSIYESDLSDARKSQQLAYYLDDAIRERLRVNPRAELFLTQGRLDSAVTKARASSTFMGALGAAQPVVSAALAFGNSAYDSVDVKIDVAGNEIDARIEQEFAPLKRQLSQVKALELNASARYTLLSRYRLGEAGALDSLRALDAEAAEAMPAGKRPPAATLDATDKRILGQLETMTSIRKNLEGQFEQYRAQQGELDALRVQARESTRLGRITLILWARSHRNLAAGVTVPASINVMGMIQNAAVKATGAVIP